MQNLDLVVETIKKEDMALKNKSISDK